MAFICESGNTFANRASFICELQIHLGIVFHYSNSINMIFLVCFDMCNLWLSKLTLLKFSSHASTHTQQPYLPNNYPTIDPEQQDTSTHNWPYLQTYEQLSVMDTSTHNWPYL